MFVKLKVEGLRGRLQWNFWVFLKSKSQLVQRLSTSRVKVIIINQIQS